MDQWFGPVFGFLALNPASVNDQGGCHLGWGPGAGAASVGKIGGELTFPQITQFCSVGGRGGA